MKAPAGTDPLDRTRFPADPWALRETRFEASDLGVTESLFAVGNGHLGLRGNQDEGRDVHAHGTFVNGFHEVWPIRHAEDAYGFARVGQSILNAPDAKTIALTVDGEPLRLSTATLEHYERTLSFRDGVLTRDLTWQTASGKRIRVRSRRLVSLAERDLALADLEFTVDAPATVTVGCCLVNRQDEHLDAPAATAASAEFDPRLAATLAERVLQPALASADDGRLALGYSVTASGMTVAVVADHTIESTDPYGVTTEVGPDRAELTYTVQATAGTTTRVTKAAAYHTASDAPVSELATRAVATLDHVRAAGTASLFTEQKAWLDDFWQRSDVEVGAGDAVQQAVRWNLFQLIGASARADGTGIPAKGVTGSGYDGHYFWDTEIYVLPFLTYTSPQCSRNALHFRYLMLDAARRRAAEMSQTGALFPWRTINGEEASAYYPAGTAQYHIDADIAYAVAQYAAATGDEAFMAREGLDILVETARLWADLGFWSPRDKAFHIHSVTGPDEYTAVVDDNLYTNVMARANLRSAVRAARALAGRDPKAYADAVARLDLDEAELAEFERIADGMHLPYDEALGIDAQDDSFLGKEVWDLPNTPLQKRPLLLHFHPLVIYRHQVLKQADVVLALYLQGDAFSADQKRADFDYYDPLTTGDSTLSSVVQAILAAEVGYADLALRHFTGALFVDLADLHSNTEAGVHVASIGGVWSALVGGFGGWRDHAGVWSFDPRLPDAWTHLTFPLTIRGNRLRVRVEHESITLTLETGDAEALPVRVQGTEVTVTRGVPAVVPLVAPPHLDGEPRWRF